MARLSSDAIAVLARLHPSEELTIRDIAIRVFDGACPGSPSTIKPIALARATRAAKVLIARGLAYGIPDRFNIVSLRSADRTGGSVQAQTLMNVMVRRAVDQRSGIERRNVEIPDRRQQEGRRRVVRPANATDKPGRRTEDYTSVPSSPFDIPKNFKILG